MDNYHQFAKNLVFYLVNNLAKCTGNVSDIHSLSPCVSFHQLLSNGTLTAEEADKLTVEDVPEEEMALNLVDDEGQEEGYLPHAYSSKQRRRLLQRAGVLHIEREEKRQLQELRRWREDCGCHCQGFCEPLTCACSLAGIKCQVP